MPLIVKRIPKSRKQYNCFSCGKSILKGSPYYQEKYVDFSEEGIYAQRLKICPKCVFMRSRSSERFKRFKPNCHHPLKGTVYRYIPGECVQEPDYDECLVCGKRGC